MSYHLSIFFFLKAYAGFMSPWLSNFFFFVSLSYGGPCFFLISSAVTWDFSTLILSPSSAPPPLPAAGTPPPPARSGSLASLSVSVQCNEQIEWNSQAEGDQEEGKPLSSQSTLWGHPPGPPGTFTGFSLPVSRDNAGCRGRRLPAPF